MVRILVTGEKANEGSLVSMADMDAAAEALVSGDTLLGLADSGGTHEVGRLQGETEKDLSDEVVVIERILPLSRRRGWSVVLASAADHVTRVV
jgi:hypothetical protein